VHSATRPEICSPTFGAPGRGLDVRFLLVFLFNTMVCIAEHRDCWGLVLKCYELRTRQHKMLNINALRPLKHYLSKDLMNFGRRP
jgi:hypothetical protein